MLTPNSLYSLANLHQQPSTMMSPTMNFQQHHQQHSMMMSPSMSFHQQPQQQHPTMMMSPPMSAPPRHFSGSGSMFGFGAGRGQLQEQVFFGPDFNPTSFQSSFQQQQPPSTTNNNNNQLLDSGGGTAMLGGGDSSGGGAGADQDGNNKRANSTDSLLLMNNFTEQFDYLLNLRSPLHVPMSAPPFSLSAGMGGDGVGGTGMYPWSNFNRSGGPRYHHQQRKVSQRPSLFALKVFLGGIPPMLTTNIIQLNFAKFGTSTIDWPNKTQIQDRPPNGYAFVVFEEEQSIIKMLGNCQKSNERVFFPVHTLDGQVHPIEVKVWEMQETMHTAQMGWRRFRRYSVFVGGIPRTCTAALLALAVEEVLGQVAYCAIELDQGHYYPKGAACVVFTNRESYVRAIAAHNVDLNFGTFERKVEFKPFLASNMPCEKCGVTSGTRFCQEMVCLAYFCRGCWKLAHNPARPSMNAHQPTKRETAGGGAGGAGGGGRNGRNNLVRRTKGGGGGGD